jgi:hypothetical protein
VFFIADIRLMRPPRTMGIWWRSDWYHKKFVNLRYQLLPYCILFWQYIEAGIPMLKPLVYYDQEDTQTH